MAFDTLLVLFNKQFTIWVVLPSLVLLGGYLSWRLRCVQATKLMMGFATLFKKDEKEHRGEGNVSCYQAISAVLGSSFGTGNIAGMAVALATGGPGSLFWMWVMTFLGSVVQFANSLLGVKYRQKNSRGEFVGGPMYYLQHGLGWKKLAGFFALFVILGSFTSGPFVQANSVALPLAKIGISPWISGIGMAILVGFAVIGGAMRIAKIASAVVPVMAFFYIGGAVIALTMFHGQLIPACSLIIKNAFGFSSAMGGLLGFGVMQAIIFGFNRAIFATDAGTGIAPLVQSNACSKHPVLDGVATLIAPFLVMIVCTVTFLTLIVTGAHLQPGLESTNMVVFAFSKALGMVGPYIVFIGLFLFGYTCTIGMAACLDRGVEYLLGDRWIKPFRWLYILMVVVGAVIRVDLAWILADISLTMMLVINVAATAGLSKEVIAGYREFFTKKQPVLPDADLS